MDPLTAAFNALTALVTLGTKVFDATPEAQKATGAADWANFTHNIAAVVISLQAKINAVVQPKPTT